MILGFPTVVQQLISHWWIKRGFPPCKATNRQMIINLKNTVNTGPDLQLFPDNKVVNSIIPVRAGYGIPRYTLQKTGQKNLRLGDAVPKSYPIFYPIIHMNHYESIFSHIDCPILIHNPYFIPYKIIFIHIFQRFFFSEESPVYQAVSLRRSC